MIILLSGQDIVSKMEFLDQLMSTKSSVSIQKFSSEDQLPNPNELVGESLFGDSVVWVFKNCLSGMNEDYLDQIRESKQSVFMLEETLDKRTAKVKNLLKFKKADGVIAKDFPAPDLDKAPAWITARAKTLGVKIDSAAAQKLTEFIMGQTVATLPILSTDQELKKLMAYANGKTITSEMVIELVSPKDSIDVFKLTDAISNQQKSVAIELLSRYYQTETGDEKSITIRLIGLLSEQWRSMLIAKDFAERGVPQAEIISKTGWKSGRLFIMKKLSANFSSQALIEALHKLSVLEKELKQRDLPSHLIVDMIVVGLI